MKDNEQRQFTRRELGVLQLLSALENKSLDELSAMLISSGKFQGSFSEEDVAEISNQKYAVKPALK